MPDWTEEIRRRLTGARLDPADEANVVEELAQHLEDRYRELKSRGVSDDEARRRTLDELEGRGDLGEAICAAGRSRAPAPVPIGATLGRGRVGALWGDLRFGSRMLRRAPGFTLVAVLTLALGIGANAAIFSIVHALLFRPLPGIERQNELVLLGRTQAGEGFDTFSYPDYLDYRDGVRALAGVVAHHTQPAHLSTGGASERGRVQLVSGNFFEVLGVRAATGRVLLPRDDGGPGVDPVVVLAHGLWRRRFGGDSSIVGRAININGQPFTVVGIADERFRGIEIGNVADAFVTLSMTPRLLREYPEMLSHRGAVWLEMFGRLAPSASWEQAREELTMIAARLGEAHPETNEERGITVAPQIGFDPGTRDDVRTFTGVLLGVAALVLLIACANVANLLLARGSVREREMAVRASLGASRSRLLRQLLAEGLLLSVLGGVAGLVLGMWLLPVILQLPVFADVGLAMSRVPDWPVLAFTATVALLAGIVFSLAPALRASRAQLVTTLRSGTPGSGDHRSRLRSGLLVAQLALSLVLLVAAGLFMRTLQALNAVDPGFATRQVLVASLDLGLQGYDEARARGFLTEVEQRTAAVPGVRGVALAHMLPLGGGGWDTRVFNADVVPAENYLGERSDINAVTPGYFAALGMPIIGGRGFTAADDTRAPAVAIVNEALAETLWPGASPIGRRFRMGRSGEPIEVVGLVPTAKYRSLLESPRALLYRPAAQAFQASMTLHVRADGDPLALVPAIESIVADLDPDLPLYRTGTLAARLDRSLAAQRTSALMVGTYGALALILAAVGLYGSMGYAISRRTRELGIRMALGASSAGVMRQVMGEALRIALLGVVIGLVAAVPAARVLRSQLFGVEPGDPATFGMVAVLLGMVTVAAAFLPARRATRVDPVVALRDE